jgi:hypothetical protein
MKQIAIDLQQDVYGASGNLDQQYYIRSRGRVQGPYTPSRLKELAKRGKFGKYHHISVDRVNWERASAHPELFPDVGPPKMRNPSPRGMDLADPAAGNATDESDSDLLVDDPASAADQEWYYSQRGEQINEPVSRQQLEQLIASGQLTPDEFVWTSGMPYWDAAATVFPELFASPQEVPSQDAGVVSIDVEPNSRAKSSAPMAVASFVLGLLGGTVFFFIGSILAIVFGHIALKQIGASEGELEGRGLALTGLILGYIVVTTTVVGVVVFILLSILGVAAATSS